MDRRVILIAAMLLLIFTISCKETPIVQNTSLTTMAWIYPGNDVCSASSEIADGRKIDVLKPEYYTLNDDGTLKLLTSGCNAYSSTNIALVKQYSSQQFVTISGSTAGMSMLTTNGSLTSQFISTLLSFLQSSGFTGIELDFEGFAQWTTLQYNSYKGFISTVGNALHSKGYKLMIDGPAISDATYQGYYLWKWEDFDDVTKNPALANAIDYMTVMAYDEQDDQGAGTPVASLAWIGNICQWMLSKISNHRKIVVGINSYGYHSRTGAYNVTKDTYEQSTQMTGFSDATRDASSGELMWVLGQMSYDFSDSTTLDGKLKAILQNGIQNVSVWHLGGSNPWFSGMHSAPIPSPQPATNPIVTLTLDQIKAIAHALTADQITTIRNAITE